MTSEIEIKLDADGNSLFSKALKRQVVLFNGEVDRLNYEKINSLEHLEAQAYDIVNNIRRRREYLQAIQREQDRLEDLNESQEPRKKRDMTSLLSAAHSPDETEVQVKAGADEEAD